MAWRNAEKMGFVDDLWVITSLDEARQFLRAVPQIGFAHHPHLLLPLLRAGCLSVMASPERAGADWSERFDVETVGAPDAVRGNFGARASLDRLASALPATVGQRWRGLRVGLISHLPAQPNWLAAVAALGVTLAPTRPLPSHPALTDKTAMRDWLRGLGLATPADMVVDALDYRRLRQRFGSTFVVQRPTGAGGVGTVLVQDEQTLRQAPPAPRWLVSAYAGDLTLNFHGVVSVDGSVSAHRPSLQVTDVAGIGAAFGWYSGCDFHFPSLLPAVVLDRGCEAVLRIGAALARLGHVGAFGVDFLVADDGLLALEVNCRMQGSTWLLGEIELAEQTLPTQIRHAVECYGHPSAAKPSLDPRPASQLMIRHIGPPGQVRSAPRGGVYSAGPDTPRWRRIGFGLLECGSDECALVDPPLPGARIGGSAPLARLVSRAPLTTADGKRLSAHGKRLVDAFYGMFAVDPC